MYWQERRRRGNWFGAIVLVAVGVIGLLANFDILPHDWLEQLWKLWPVIPLLIGVGILLRRREGHEIQSPPPPKS
jgi:cadmium resistance protein CadD (predicted permease)